jgi:hypothetical protein
MQNVQRREHGAPASTGGSSPRRVRRRVPSDAGSFSRGAAGCAHIGVVRDATVLLDQRHDARQRPESQGVPVRFRPAFNARSTVRTSAVVSLSLRPARPARRKPGRRSSASMSCQRYTDCRWALTSRATSAWDRPARSNRTAANRRTFNHSKSRRTPPGLPMHRVYHNAQRIVTIVTILCKSQ